VGFGPRSTMHHPAVACLKRLPWLSVLVAVVALAIISFASYPGSVPGNHAWPVTELNLDQYSLPMAVKDTVPTYALALFPTFLCMILVATECWVNRKVPLRHKIEFGMLLTMTVFEVFIVTTALTSLCKVIVSEPRPDLKERCLGSADANVTVDEHGFVNCTGDAALVQDGRESFPSGHASASMCVGAFGTMYLIWLAYVRKIDVPWRASKGCQSVAMYQISQALFFTTMIPMFIALGIAASRIHDHRHSPADVVAGSFIGVLVAACYFFGRLLQALPEDKCVPETTCPCKESTTSMDELVVVTAS